MGKRGQEPNSGFPGRNVRKSGPDEELSILPGWTTWSLGVESTRRTRLILG